MTSVDSNFNFLCGRPHGRACFKKNSSLYIWPKNFPFYLSTFLMNFFQSSPTFTIFYSSTKKISSRPFLRFQPKIFLLISQKFSLPFLVIDLFSEFHPLNINIIQITPISYYFYTLYPLYTQLHPIFPFLHLTFYSPNSKYYIHLLFFLTSSLHKQPFNTAHFRSSLHIFCITAR